MTALQKIRWIVFATLFLLLGLIATSIISLKDRIDSLDVGSPTGPVWFMTGVEFDTLKLELALSAYAAGQAEPVEVNQQFDILWSRLDSVQQGATAQKLKDYRLDTTPLEDLFTLLRDNEFLILSLTDEIVLPERIATFSSELASFHADLRALSLNVLSGSSAEAKGWRDDLIGVSDQNTVLIGLVVVAFVVLAVMLLLENLRTKAVLREKEDLLQASHAANTVKSEFISVMNHELRTPLSSIRGAVSLLNSFYAKSYSEKERRLLDLALRNCEHLSSLVQDILDVEKFGSGRFDMKPQMVVLADAVMDQMPNFAALSQDHGITVLMQEPQTDIVCGVDPERLRQVLSNLVFNAIKFSSSGTTIRIGVKKIGAEGVISIADEGVGIPASSYSRIFDAFYQVDSSNKRRAGGTGLGLSICKSLVEGMGGKIWFDSVVDKGTTFYIAFPEKNHAHQMLDLTSSTAA